MKYRGSCHCGNVAYEVEGEIDKAIACNCSMCQRKGSLLWFAPIEKFQAAHAGVEREALSCSTST